MKIKKEEIKEITTKINEYKRGYTISIWVESANGDKAYHETTQKQIKDYEEESKKSREELSILISENLIEINMDEYTNYIKSSISLSPLTEEGKKESKIKKEEQKRKNEEEKIKQEEKNRKNEEEKINLRKEAKDIIKNVKIEVIKLPMNGRGYIEFLINNENLNNYLLKNNKDFIKIFYEISFKIKNEIKEKNYKLKEKFIFNF